jgi:hypothetical protein
LLEPRLSCQVCYFQRHTAFCNLPACSETISRPTDPTARRTRACLERSRIFPQHLCLRKLSCRAVTSTYLLGHPRPFGKPRGSLYARLPCYQICLSLTSSASCLQRRQRQRQSSHHYIPHREASCRISNTAFIVQRSSVRLSNDSYQCTPLLAWLQPGSVAQPS